MKISWKIIQMFICHLELNAFRMIQIWNYWSVSRDFSHGAFTWNNAQKSPGTLNLWHCLLKWASMRLFHEAHTSHLKIVLSILFQRIWTLGHRKVVLDRKRSHVLCWHFQLLRPSIKTVLYMSYPCSLLAYFATTVWKSQPASNYGTKLSHIQCSWQFDCQCWRDLQYFGSKRCETET